MRLNKTTPWFPPEVKPVHKGVYQRDYSDRKDGTDLVYCHFNGKYWGCYGNTVDEALRYWNVPAAAYGVPWRGLVCEATS